LCIGERAPALLTSVTAWGLGIGRRSARHAWISRRLNHHGYVGGAPGSGKTTLLRLLIQGYPGPVIALDAKGSPDLADTVWSLPGHVWELGGPLKLDLLDPEPWGCWYWSVWELACSSTGVYWH